MASKRRRQEEHEEKVECTGCERKFPASALSLTGLCGSCRRDAYVPMNTAEDAIEKAEQRFHGTKFDGDWCPLY